MGGNYCEVGIRGSFTSAEQRTQRPDCEGVSQTRETRGGTGEAWVGREIMETKGKVPFRGCCSSVHKGGEFFETTERREEEVTGCRNASRQLTQAGNVI